MYNLLLILANLVHVHVCVYAYSEQYHFYLIPLKSSNVLGCNLYIENFVLPLSKHVIIIIMTRLIIIIKIIIIIIIIIIINAPMARIPRHSHLIN